MSTSAAIEAVTVKLLDRLTVAEPGATAKPLDKLGPSKLNLFLFQIVLSATWRNQDLPCGTRQGQPSRPLLPLILSYLVTACEEDQKQAHKKLGEAMLAFHDEPKLTGFSESSGIRNQADPIRVTVQPLSLDEMSKLWSSFQAPYRPSVAYEVGVVLIESELTSPAPLPVLRQGDQGLGWDTTTQLPAVLISARFQTDAQPGMHLGETVTLLGRNLMRQGEIQVVFRHPRLVDELIVRPDQVADSGITITIPNAPEDWPAGSYTATVQYRTSENGVDRVSSSTEITVTMLPEIIVPLAGLMAVHTGDNRSLAVPCKPKLRPGQNVQVLIGSACVTSVDISNSSRPIARWRKSEVEFPRGELPFARLRVDGADSLIHNPAEPTQNFNENYKVKNLS